MLGMIVRRLLQLPIILGVIYTITLVLAWGIPGNPLENPEGRAPAAEVREAMLAQYNLDSVPTFYASYLSNASGATWVRHKLGGGGAEAGARPVFDLGPSLKYEDWSVNEIIAGTLPVSVTLGAVAILIALTIG